jgi:hypothetical protein
MASDPANLILVGAGAVENSWDPVIVALRSIGFPDVATAGAANFALARLVYIARLAERDPATTPIAKSKNDVRAKLAEVKRAIARELTDATARRKIGARREFADVMRRFVLLNNAEVGVITTNWDKTVERQASTLHAGQPVMYVHGHVDDADGLYLPTEVAEEPYREPAQRRPLIERRRDLVRAITRATRLVFYGLGLSALDAELGQIVASGIHNSSVTEIIVVNPHYVHVADRIATLNDGGSLTMPIRCCLPTRLDQMWTYTSAGALAEIARLGAPCD